MATLKLSVRLVLAAVWFLSGAAYAERCIGDRVWLDDNGDGIQQASEPGVAGAQLTLVDGVGHTMDEATSNSLGFWSLCGEGAVGTLQVLAPQDYEFTTPDAGTSWRADYDDSDVDALGIVGVALKVGKRNHWDVGLVLTEENTTGSADESEPSPGENTNPLDSSVPDSIILHLIGQSNAAGRALSPSVYTNEVGFKLPDGTILTEENAPNDRPNFYGVELPLSVAWPSDQQVFLAKTGVGSSEIQDWLDGYWETHVGTLDAALALPANAQDVVLWVQGESDASRGNVATYAARTHELFDRVAARLAGAVIVDVLLNEDEVLTVRLILATGEPWS